jgi:hypothetical protein
MDLEVLKISKMQMAHKDETIPISAIRLSPDRMFSKSKRVALKMIKPNARAINMYIKIFIVKLI